MSFRAECLKTRDCGWSLGGTFGFVSSWASFLHLQNVVLKIPLVLITLHTRVFVCFWPSTMENPKPLFLELLPGLRSLECNRSRWMDTYQVEAAQGGGALASWVQIPPWLLCQLCVLGQVTYPLWAFTCKWSVVRIMNNNYSKIIGWLLSVGCKWESYFHSPILEMRQLSKTRLRSCNLRCDIAWFLENRRTSRVLFLAPYCSLSC